VLVDHEQSVSIANRSITNFHFPPEESDTIDTTNMNSFILRGDLTSKVDARLRARQSDFPETPFLTDKRFNDLQKSDVDLHKSVNLASKV
jgi:hypothetical protein